MPHRRDFGEAGASHLAENALGRLLLRGLISPEMHNAGCMFRARELAYKATIGGPGGLAKGNGRGSSCSPMRCVAYALCR
jgi:hypothetical protein